jgi:hypothetical protein
MPTFAEQITGVREILNDVDAVRWTDTDLMRYSNEFMRETRRIRPDLYLGTYGQNFPTYDIEDEFPLDITLLKYLDDYVIHRAHVREEEYVDDKRAMLFFETFRAGLMQA